jgi:hypothetical protein
MRAIAFACLHLLCHVAYVMCVRERGYVRPPSCAVRLGGAARRARPDRMVLSGVGHETWPPFAGWRGLRERAVRSHFNNTLFAFEGSGWGPNEAIMSNFGLFYNVAVLGAGAPEAGIKAMLHFGQPALFYLWTPHAMLADFELPPS